MLSVSRTTKTNAGADATTPSAPHFFRALLHVKDMQSAGVNLPDDEHPEGCMRARKNVLLVGMRWNKFSIP